MIFQTINTLLRKPRPFTVVGLANNDRYKEYMAALQSKVFWENSQLKAIVKELSDSGVKGCFDEQKLNETIGPKQKTIIFSLVSKEYLLVGENWVKYISSLGLSNYVLFCGDQTSYAYYRKRNIPCIELKLPSVSGCDTNLAGFLPKGLLMASMKFIICRLLLEKGYNVVFSDIDAFWIKNPMELLKQSDHDLAFQNIYLFPQEVVRLWGFAACSGFFFVRCSNGGKELVRSAQEYVVTNCDDQVALNLALIRRQIIWDYGDTELVRSYNGHPIRVFWQKMRSGHGIYSPVRGRSIDGSISVTSLPQILFRRHMFMELSLNPVYVFHPNSPKSEQGKLDVFRSHGFSVNSTGC